MDTHALPRARRTRSGRALGTILMGLTALALVGFLIQTTPGCSEEGATAPPETSGPPASAPTQTPETPPEGPETAEIDDVDEPAGMFAFELPVLAFREHSEGLPKTGTWLGYPTLADLDGDGDCDLVASNREEDGVSTWRFDPDRPWELVTEGLPRDMSYGPTAVADVDGDGDNDLLIGDHTQALRVFLNNGDMTVWKESEEHWPAPFILKDIAVTDFNGDARADLVTINHFKGGIQVYLGTPQGGFQMLGAEITHDRMFGQKLALADFDQDGLDDIAADANEGLLVFLTRMVDGELAWEPASDGLPAPEIGNSLFGLAAGVFDESRENPQLVVCSVPDPGLDAEEMNGIGVWALSQADSITWVQIDEGLRRDHRYKDVLAADFNQDGHLDVICASLEEGRPIYLGDGTGKFRPAGRIVGHGKSRLTVADVDGDGYPDVLTSTSGQKGKEITGKLRLFLNSKELWD